MPKAVSDKNRLPGKIVFVLNLISICLAKGQANSPTDTAVRARKGTTPSPDVYATATTRNKPQVTFKGQPVRIKSPSGREYEIEWTADDVRSIFDSH